jgi:hypothetical protein
LPSEGYHVTCQNAKLYEIPFNLTRFLQTTNHQNIIVDLSSNFLSIIPCDFIQISKILTLILTNNRIEYLSSCFSQSSIENLLLNSNPLQFNQTTILSSSKLLHLDISSNKILFLPRTFLLNLRKLRRLIINGEKNLFELNNNNQWIQSLTTRNQLTIIICNENFPLPLCLFDNLFQTNKLLSIELNINIHCDCSFVYLPLEKIHFHYCQSQQSEKGICNLHSSRFEQGHSLLYLQNNKYRQICSKEYQICQEKNSQLIHIPLKNNFLSLIKNYSINQSITTTTKTFSKKENLTLGAIISFVLVLLIITIVCIYVILSGNLFKMKNRELIINKKKKQNLSSGMKNDECISIENLNMNFNPQKKNSFQSYSDEESELTFYSIHNSSISFIQSSSMAEIESLTSTINSSISNETVIISNRNK